MIRWIINNSLSFITTFFLIGILHSQENKDYEFVRFLTESKKHKEALYLLDNNMIVANPDTIFFLKGLNYYYLKKTDSAAYYFDKVSPSIGKHHEAVFFSALNYYLSDKHIEANKQLQKLEKDTIQRIKQLSKLFLSGSYIIQRNNVAFDSISRSFSYDHYAYANEQKNLVVIHKEACGIKKKSAFAAATLSAFVPGLGKFYVGKRGAALAAFASNMVLAGIAAESYYRERTFRSPQFIISTSLFSFFYVGNIIGSAYSVRQQKKQNKSRINNEVLANIHGATVRYFK